MCAFQNNRGGNASFQGFFPPHGAQAPAIACFQADKAVFGSWGDEIVAPSQRKIQKFLRDFCAHHMAALVMVIRIAAAIPVIPG
jgi:hypothetical protein